MPDEIAKAREAFWKRVNDEVYDREGNAKLYGFQREGIDWLGSRPRSILADDMGLGKTMQALAAVVGAQSYPCLIICQATMRDAWAAQIRRWTGQDSYVMAPGNRKLCIRQQRTLPRNFLIVHYEGARLELEELRKFDFKALIVDEATYIKNRGAQRTKAVKLLRAPRIHLLSGTPLLNSPLDLWSLLHMLEPARWQSYYKFERRYAILGGWMGRQVVGYKNVPELQTYVRVQMKRRRKDDVLKDLPPKTYADVLVELPKWQRELYTQARDELLVEIDKDKTLTIASMLARMVRLKQIAVWPQATLGVVSSQTPVKVEALNELLVERDQAKTILFTKFARVAKNLVSWMQSKHPGYQTFLLTGETAMGDRQRLVDEFQAAPAPALWVSTIDAGGMGLTLTAADAVVFMDKDWRPKINEQAEDRAHRIGQRANVLVISLIAKDTIEEAIEKVLRKKEALFNEIIERDGGVVSAKLTVEDIKTLL